MGKAGLSQLLLERVILRAPSTANFVQLGKEQLWEAQSKRGQLQRVRAKQRIKRGLEGVKNEVKLRSKRELN